MSVGKNYNYEIYETKTNKKVFVGSLNEALEKFEIKKPSTFYNAIYREKSIHNGKYYVRQIPIKHEFVVKTLDGKNVFKGDNKEVADYLTEYDNFIWTYAKNKKIIDGKYIIEKIS